MRPLSLSLSLSLSLPGAMMATALLCAAPAHANLVTNGDFAGGDLTGWTVFTTANGTTGSGLPTVTSFDVTGGGAQNAATFNVGEANFDGTQQGGGIRQTVTFAGGVATFSASIATMTGNLFGNADGGTFIVLLDNVEQDSVAFGGIDPDTTLRDTLGFTANVSAGPHDLEIRITRLFISNLTLPSPYQYVTNISLTEETTAPIPEPATLALLGAGLLGLGAARRRKAA